MNSYTKGLHALKELQSTVAEIALDNQFSESHETKFLSFAKSFTKIVHMVERSYDNSAVQDVIEEHKEIFSSLSDIILEAQALNVNDQYSIMYGAAAKTVGIFEMIASHLPETEENFGYSDPVLKYDLMERLELEDAYQQRLAQRLQ